VTWWISGDDGGGDGGGDGVGVGGLGVGVEKEEQVWGVLSH